jgi:hypothetical protein
MELAIQSVTRRFIISMEEIAEFVLKELKETEMSVNPFVNSYLLAMESVTSPAIPLIMTMTEVIVYSVA